jgi:hypothetical protein
MLPRSPQMVLQPVIVFYQASQSPQVAHRSYSARNLSPAEWKAQAIIEVIALVRFFLFMYAAKSHMERSDRAFWEKDKKSWKKMDKDFNKLWNKITKNSDKLRSKMIEKF